MPVLYERAGFVQPKLRPEQRRFASTPETVLDQAQAIARSGRPLLRAGLAVHSLRAAAPASIHRLRRLAERLDGPIHIHVAEQTAEVDDCLASTGARPIAWLAREGLLDARWELVHATHAVAAEIEAVAASRAGVVLCPSTEANLGDGVADLRAWLAAGVPLSIGSDSHVGRDWREELRWLDYGQRLALRARSIAADPAAQPSTGARLWQRTQAGGSRAAGEPLWGFTKGARADALCPDRLDRALLGVPADQALDALVFSGPGRPWSSVMVAGRWVVRDGVHPRTQAVARSFCDAMGELWADR